eukprot:1147316-Pelagomonas_calceolata.AAC.3
MDSAHGNVLGRLPHLPIDLCCPQQHEQCSGDAVLYGLHASIRGAQELLAGAVCFFHDSIPYGKSALNLCASCCAAHPAPFKGAHERPAATKHDTLGRVYSSQPAPKGELPSRQAPVADPMQECRCFPDHAYSAS